MNRAGKKGWEILRRYIIVSRKMVRTSRGKYWGQDLREVRKQSTQIFGGKWPRGREQKFCSTGK